MFVRKNLLVVLCGLTLGTGLVSCSKKDEAAVSSNAVLKLSSMLVEVPSSVSNAPATTTTSLQGNSLQRRVNSLLATASTTSPCTGVGEDNPCGLYEIIRALVGVAELFSDQVETIADAILGDKNPNKIDLSTITVGKPFLVSNASAEVGTVGGIKLEKNGSGSTYEYTTTLYFMNASAQFVPGMVFSFTITSKTEGKGELFLNMAALTDDSDALAHFTFDTASATLGKTMTVELVGIANAADPESPDNMLMTISQNSSGIVTVSGNVFLPGAATSDDGFFAEERNYVFTGRANSITNKAIISVALPPSTSTDSTSQLFTDHSIAEVFKLGIVNVLGRADGATSTDACCCTAGAFFGISANVCSAATSCTFGGSCGARSQSASTIANAVVNYCTSNSTDANCDSFNRILNLSNPAYFDANGFVGTETFLKPTTGYSDLTLTGIPFTSAAAGKALSITFDATPVSTIQ